MLRWSGEAESQGAMITNEPITVLLIEDNPEDLRIIREALTQMQQPSCRLSWAGSLADARLELAAHPFDLILLDMSLPDSRGMELLVSVQAQAAQAPIVILTSQDNDRLALEALRYGAQDYLVKGHVQVYRGLLERSLRYAIERKHAAEELRRTHTLLIQAEKMAAIGQLANGIAHEVKNPLNILLQCVSYLEPELSARGGEPAEVWQVMREAVMTADHIIKGLVDFSRPDPVELTPVPLASVIDGALKLLDSQLACGRIRLVKTLPSTLPPVMMAPPRLTQTFLNLFLNAIQAMPEGGELRIRAAAKTLTEPGPGIGARREDRFKLGETAVVCDIEDTGMGIPEDVLPKVFHPFFTTKPPGRGVGLGLSICNSVMEQH